VPAQEAEPAAHGAEPAVAGMTGAMAARLEVLDTDITTLAVDAIANAANTQLRHGGGVAAAIARAGGEAVERGSRAAAPIGLGDAVATSAGAMPSRWVIHAATMELTEPTNADVVRRATAATLWKAEELGARSLALVAFGTGVGKFPLRDAAEIEVEEVRRHVESGSRLERIVFAVHGEEARAAFAEAVAASASAEEAGEAAPAEGGEAAPVEGGEAALAEGREPAPAEDGEAASAEEAAS
jgi:O-acetyl-ADP-ribose deacetylase (regulator of RNase III)